MTRRIRNCVCAWLRRYNKSLRGNVIQICSSLQINFYNLHKGVWRIKYSKYNNNNIVATKEVSLKSASKKRNPLVVVLLFHGVCNIKIELTLQTLPWRLPLYKSVCYSYFPTPLMSYLLLFLQQVDFSSAMADGGVILTMSHIGNSCASTFAVKKYKISHDRKALHRLSCNINWVDNVNWPPKRL